jgi:uncharacterized protein (DUF849 family)
MPLTPDEIAKNAPALAELGAALVAAFGPDSDGGKKLTKDEARRLLAKGAKTLGSALVDVID